MAEASSGINPTLARFIGGLTKFLQVWLVGDAEESLDKVTAEEIHDKICKAFDTGQEKVVTVKEGIT